MVAAAKAGISYRDFLLMDAWELAMYVRADELQKIEDMRWARFFVAALLTPHSKKPVRPTDIIKLPDDDLIKRFQSQVSTEKLKQMDEVFKKWDKKR